MEKEEKTNGALIGLIVIIIILILGGIYIWRSKIKQMEILRAQNAAIMEEQANIIRLLEEDIKNADTEVGVDAEKIK